MKPITICCMDCKFCPQSKHYKGGEICKHSEKAFSTETLDEISVLEEKRLHVSGVSREKMDEELAWRRERYAQQYREHKEKCLRGVAEVHEEMKREEKRKWGEVYRGESIGGE